MNRTENWRLGLYRLRLTGDAGNKFERSQDANGTESAQIHVQIFLDDHRHKSAKSHHIHNPTLAHYIHVYMYARSEKIQPFPIDNIPSQSMVTSLHFGVWCLLLFQTEFKLTATLNATIGYWENIQEKD